MKRIRNAGALIATLTVAALLGSAGAGSAAPSGDDEPTTLASSGSPEVEAQRVDAVATPEPDWYDCTLTFGSGTECTTVELPLDYDRPQGRTTSVAVLRRPAADQAAKVGTLFVNPGGPGGSGVFMAADAPFYFSADLLDRFDIVGFDPRGTNFSDNARCWENVGDQLEDARALWELPFPLTDAEETLYIASAEALGHACDDFGDRLTESMSTAQVARDMDVLRRMVGDEQLSYLGFSYGSYLGTVYANMFPDRVRAVAIDGILDPVEWAGTPETADIPQTRRIRSGQGAWGALQETLERCAEAGPEFCMLASIGDPEEVANSVFDRLRENPVELEDPFTGESFEITYQILVAILLGDLYLPIGPQFVDLDLSFFHSLLEEQEAPGSVDAATVEQARAALAPKAAAARQQTAAATVAGGGTSGFGLPYNNGLEAFYSVLCTDGRNPADPEAWRQNADDAAFEAPRFGRLWTWQSVPCASDTWTARDEDAYTGPFDRETAHPLLVVGNFWDPATSYDNAVSTAARLPDSALLSSDSWGHTAYGTSACVTGAMDAYLITLALPAPDTLCVGDIQPFTTPVGEPPEPFGAQRRADGPDRLPPVVPPLPGAVPRS